MVNLQPFAAPYEFGRLQTDFSILIYNSKTNKEDTIFNEK